MFVLFGIYCSNIYRHIDVFGQPAGTVSTICLLCQQTKPQLESKEKKSKTASQLGLESKIPRKQSISQ